MRNSKFFFTVSSLRRDLSPTRALKWPGSIQVQITCNTSSAYHVQHVCHVGRRDSSAIKFDRVEIVFILAVFYWLKKGRKPKYADLTPDDELQKMPHTKGRKFKPQPRLEPAL